MLIKKWKNENKKGKNYYSITLERKKNCNYLSKNNENKIYPLKKVKGKDIGIHLFKKMKNIRTSQFEREEKTTNCNLFIKKRKKKK